MGYWSLPLKTSSGTTLNKRPPVVKIQRCWQCNQPTPGEVYLLSYGGPGIKTPYAYLCGRDCLWKYLTDNWETL